MDSLPLSHQESPSPQDNWVFILLFLLFILVNLEVVQLVTFFAVSNSMQPITWIILLQIFFWWDISNTFGKRHHRSCGNLAFTSFGCHCPFPKFPAFPFALSLEETAQNWQHPWVCLLRMGTVKRKLQDLLLSFLPIFTTSFFTGAMVAAEAAERLSMLLWVLEW